MPSFPLRSAPYVIALVMGTLLACSSNGTTIDDEQLLDDVLYCEDAIAHLEDCCPGFVATQLRCVHYKKEVEPQGCSSGTHSTQKEEPALDLGESTCIRAASCEHLVSNGVCARAQAARGRRSGRSQYEDPEGHDHDGPVTSYDTPHQQVCP